MSDQTQSSNQQVVVYALVAIAVLLAVIVGFMIYNNMNNAGAGANSAASSSTAADAAAQSVAGSMPSQSAPVTFDAKTATKLPAGVTPEQALKTYMEDLTAKKWTEAYALLPLQQKNSYGDASAYGQQVAGYGISGYRLGKPQSSGSDVTIVSEQDTSAMNITYTWVYTKVGNDWFVKSRTMGGTLQ